MIYNQNLFTQDKSRDFKTRFHFVYSGAFYDVYTDDDVSFHMPFESKASLLARISFYRKYISLHPYPVFIDDYNLPHEVTEKEPGEVLRQVLGLPDICIYDAQGKVLDPDAILKRIAFDSDLSVDCSFEAASQFDFLAKNDYAMIQAINTLIENGFFFMNIDSILTDNKCSVFYPAYLDMSLVKEKYKPNPNAELLLMRYTDEPLNVGAKTFLDEFKSIDYQKNIEALFHDSMVEDIDSLSLSQMALRNYFVSIMREIINDFLYERFGKVNYLGYTMNNHDYGMDDFPYPYFAIGSSYLMVYDDYLKVDRKEDGSYSGKIVFDHPCLRKEDLGKLKVSFERTKKFMEIHEKDYHFMPPLFLYLMGLPYESYPIARFFDFRNGSFEDFVSLFDIIDNCLFQNALVMLPMIDTYYRFDQMDVNWITLYHSLKERALFFDLSWNLDSLRPLDSIDSSHISGFFVPYDAYSERFLRGDVNCLNELASDYGLLFYRNRKEGIEELEAFRKARPDISLSAFFSKVNEGYDFYEAARGYLDQDDAFDLCDIIFRLLIALLSRTYTRNCGKDEDTLFKDEVLYPTLSKTFTFSVPGREYPFVHVGYRFIGYSKDRDGKDMVFDSKDEETILKEWTSKRKRDCFFGWGHVPAVIEISPSKSKLKPHGLPGSFHNRKEFVFVDGVSILKKEYRDIILLSSRLARLSSYQGEQYRKLKDADRTFFDMDLYMDFDEDIETGKPKNQNPLIASYERMKGYPKSLLTLDEKNLLCLDDLSIIQNSRISFENSFVDEKTGCRISVGENFYAVYDESKKRFCLLEEDRKEVNLLLESVFHSMTYRHEEYGADEIYNKSYIRLRMIDSVGIPRCVMEGKGQVNQLSDLIRPSDYTDKFSFSMEDRKRFNSFLTHDSNVYVPLGGMVDSNIVKNRLRKEGLYLTGGVSFFSEKLNDLEDDFLTFTHDFQFLLDSMMLFIDEKQMSNNVLRLMKPSATCFRSMLDHFFDKYQDRFFDERDSADLEEILASYFDQFGENSFLVLTRVLFEFNADLFRYRLRTNLNQMESIDAMGYFEDEEIEMCFIRFIIDTIQNIIYFASQDLANGL